MDRWQIKQMEDLSSMFKREAELLRQANDIDAAIVQERRAIVMDWAIKNIATLEVLIKNERSNRN